MLNSPPAQTQSQLPHSVEAQRSAHDRTACPAAISVGREAAALTVLGLYTNILSTEDKHLPSSLTMNTFSRLVVVCHMHDKDSQDDFLIACLNPDVYRVKAHQGN